MEQYLTLTLESEGYFDTLQGMYAANVFLIYIVLTILFH